MAEARLFRPADRDILSALLAEGCGWRESGDDDVPLNPEGSKVWLARLSRDEKPEGFCRLIPDREALAWKRACLDLLFVREGDGRQDLACALISAALSSAHQEGLEGIWGYLIDSPGEDILNATGGKKRREIRLLRHERLNKISSPDLPKGYRLRPISLPADLKLTADIYNNTFSEMWNFRSHGPDDISEWFKSPDTKPENCLILDRDVEKGEEAEGVGLAVLSVDPERLAQSDPTAYIPDIGVISAHRRRGLGKVLISAAAERARNIGMTDIELIVDEEDQGARAFYRKLGFTEMGKINVFEWG